MKARAHKRRRDWRQITHKQKNITWHQSVSVDLYSSVSAQWCVTTLTNWVHMSTTKNITLSTDVEVDSMVVERHNLSVPRRCNTFILWGAKWGLIQKFWGDLAEMAPSFYYIHSASIQSKVVDARKMPTAFADFSQCPNTVQFQWMSPMNRRRKESW